MMKRKMSMMIWLSVLMTTMAATAIAAEVKKRPQVAKNEPIQIVSDRMDAYHDKRMVVFSGNAVATQGARTIRSDRLVIYYKEGNQQSKKGTGAAEGVGDLERVEAKGHVKITEGNRIVTGDEAIFQEDAEKITMVGNAVMREGTNVIRGDRIVVFLNENRGVVESTENKRVTATIYPNESKGKAP